MTMTVRFGPKMTLEEYLTAQNRISGIGSQTLQLKTYNPTFDRQQFINNRDVSPSDYPKDCKQTVNLESRDLLYPFHARNLFPRSPSLI
jgi:hypothetical protein